MTSPSRSLANRCRSPGRMKEYDPGVAVDRITVSLDADLARRIRLQAELEGRTVSAWLSDAAAAELGRQGLAAVIADYEAEFGAFTDEEMQAAKERLGW